MLLAVREWGLVVTYLLLHQPLQADSGPPREQWTQNDAPAPRSMRVGHGERSLVDVEGGVDERVLGELCADAVYLAVFLGIIEVELCTFTSSVGITKTRMTDRQHSPCWAQSGRLVLLQKSAIYLCARSPHSKPTVFLMQQRYILRHLPALPDVVVRLVPAGDGCNARAWKPRYRVEVQTVQRERCHAADVQDSYGW